MEIDLPEQLAAAISDIVRKTNKSENDVVISLLGLGVEVAPYNDLVRRYVRLLSDPEQKRWADTVETVLDRTIPAN